MADITLTTNGTIEGTKLTVDGKEISKKDKIINIDFYAYAPYKCSYSGDSVAGGVSVGYVKANEDGTVERVAISSAKDTAIRGIGQKIKTADQIIRYVGQEADAAVVNLVDKITNHCEANKIPVVDKTLLLNRSVQSLKDKCEDLGIKLED
jgi:hypothetical protein